MKINRRIFLGSTFALALHNKSVYGEVDLLKMSKEPDRWLSTPIIGELISYKWDLAEIEFKQLGVEHNGLIRYVQFPLLDKLVIKSYYDEQKNTLVTSVYNVFNWQLQGLPFDIIDFSNLKPKTTYTNNISDYTVIYRNTPFILESITFSNVNQNSL